MKYLLTALPLLLFTFGSKAQSTESFTALATQKRVSPVTYANTITHEELKEHLYTFASDEFMGRKTGAKGDKIAIKYLTDTYTNLNLEPASEGMGYLQPIEFTKFPPTQGTMHINTLTLTLGEDIFLMNPNMDVKYEGQAIDVGYGIETENYSDYSGIDVKDKIVIIRTGEPQNPDGTYVISGTQEESQWSDLKKGNLAYKKGAKGVIFCFSDANELMKQWLKKGKLTLGDKPLKSVDLSNSKMEFLTFENLPKRISLENQQRTNGEIFSIKVSTERKRLKVSSNNVIAYIKGKSKPEEYIVVSAHLDHEGMNENGEIYNGADDNGSGTVALLEIAEAFKKAVNDGNGPERSIIFLHTTAEEDGLLGSEYYTSNPPFPLENTLANLNADMIGRSDPKRKNSSNYVLLVGSNILSNDLHELSEKTNATYTQLELDYSFDGLDHPQRFYYRTDSYNFAKHNIPVIFYTNEDHPDYHQPTDTPDKINYDLLTKRTKLIFHTAWELANRTERIKLDKVEAE